MALSGCETRGHEIFGFWDSRVQDLLCLGARAHDLRAFSVFGHGAVGLLGSRTRFWDTYVQGCEI